MQLVKMFYEEQNTDVTLIINFSLTEKIQNLEEDQKANLIRTFLAAFKTTNK